MSTDISAIHQKSFLSLVILIALLSLPYPYVMSFVRMFKLTQSAIAPATKTSLASADSRCVTSRLRKKPALVRYTYNLRFKMIMMLTFQDVTTRGEYYPDKSMATAAV